MNRERGRVKLQMWVASGNPVVFLVDERVQEVDKVSHRSAHSVSSSKFEASFCG